MDDQTCSVSASAAEIIEIHGWVCEQPESVNELWIALRNLHVQQRWLFRGERCRFKDCKPGIARQPGSNWYEVGPGGCDLDVALISAQQHGDRTPMVDWTRHPLVALYFAADEHAGNDEDVANGVDRAYARIWCFDWEGAYPTLGRQWDRLGDVVNRKPNLHVNISALLKYRVPGWIVVEQLQDPFDRVRKQQAVVTIAGDPSVCHLSAITALEPHRKDHRRVFEFPSAWKRELRDLCASYEINDVSLGLTSSERPSLRCDASTVTATTNLFGSV